MSLSTVPSSTRTFTFKFGLHNKSGCIHISNEHSQILVNSSKLDQRHHCWGEAASKKRPSISIGPVFRLPVQAWLLWADTSACSPQQGLTLCSTTSLSMVEAAIRDAGHGKKRVPVCVASCFSVLLNAFSLTSLLLDAQAVLVLHTPCIPGVEEVTLVFYFKPTHSCLFSPLSVSSPKAASCLLSPPPHECTCYCHSHFS